MNLSTHSRRTRPESSFRCWWRAAAAACRSVSAETQYAPTVASHRAAAVRVPSPLSTEQVRFPFLPTPLHRAVGSQELPIREKHLTDFHRAAFDQPRPVHNSFVWTIFRLKNTHRNETSHDQSDPTCCVPTKHRTAVGLT